MTGNIETPEFSFTVAPSLLPAGGSAYTLEPTAEQCAALAGRFDLVALEWFRAELRLIPVRGGVVLRLTGTIRARVVQRCVVTLDPVAATIEAPVDILLQPAESLGDEVGFEEDVEPYEGDSIDIGEIAAEELALALDPYPRAAAAGPRGTGGRAEQAPEQGPFAALASWRPKK